MTALGSILSGFGDIGSAFVYDWSLWWVMAPIIFIWLVLEIYFGEFKKEKLGWNTALANGISLLWIVIEGMRFLFSNKIDMFWIRFLIMLFMLGYAIFIMYISFMHSFSPKVTYALAAPTPIYFCSVISILWSHGNLTITWWVLLDIFILFLFTLLFFWIVRKLIPESSKDKGAEDKGFDKGPSDLGDSGLGGELGGGLGGSESGLGGLGESGSDFDIGGGDFKL